jgi:hypothetical protein
VLHVKANDSIHTGVAAALLNVREGGGALNLAWGRSRVRFERGWSGTVLEQEVRSALLICRNKMGVTLMQRGKVTTPYPYHS